MDNLAAKSAQISVAQWSVCDDRKLHFYLCQEMSETKDLFFWKILTKTIDQNSNNIIFLAVQNSSIGDLVTH